MRDEDRRYPFTPPKPPKAPERGLRYHATSRASHRQRAQQMRVRVHQLSAWEPRSETFSWSLSSFALCCFFCSARLLLFSCSSLSLFLFLCEVVALLLEASTAWAWLPAETVPAPSFPAVSFPEMRFKTRPFSPLQPSHDLARNIGWDPQRLESRRPRRASTGPRVLSSWRVPLGR